MQNRRRALTLTGKQKRVLENIELYSRAKGQSPTLEELRRNLGFKSLRTVTQYLDSLERNGFIIRRKNSWRNIELRNLNDKGATTLVSVPVVANVGCDNLSVFAAEQRDEFLQVDEKIVESAGEIVAVRAMGVNDQYLFEVGNRAYLHQLCGIDELGILQAIAVPAA